MDHPLTPYAANDMGMRHAVARDIPPKVPTRPLALPPRGMSEFEQGREDGGDPGGAHAVRNPTLRLIRLITVECEEHPASLATHVFGPHVGKVHAAQPVVEAGEVSSHALAVSVGANP